MMLELEEARKMLNVHQQECARMVINASSTAGKLAWYYTFCGALELARDLKIVPDDTFANLSEIWQLFAMKHSHNDREE